VIAPNNITVAAVDAQGTLQSDIAITAFLNTANANDAVDGVVTVTHDAPAVFALGITTVTFSAQDKAGNTGNAQATVTVSDQSQPVINLSGNTAMTLLVNETYQEPGYSALDNVDGDISNKVVVTGAVDGTSVGVYTLSYNVVDLAGNTAATVTRQVTIQDDSTVDSDGDGIVDGNDAFPFDASEWLDTDSDGIGNNADTDDDNDGIEDSLDAFPLDNSESVDTDNDGIGNNEDTDDDNDGILDVDDIAPLDASIGDNQAPEIEELADLTIEATGTLTSISLVEPIVTDNNINPPTLSSNLKDELSLGEHLILWTAIDFVGNQSTKQQRVLVIDSTAPQFDALTPLVINSQGRITDISSQFNITAFDLVDGDISAKLVGQPSLVSGSHEVSIKAIDLSDNESVSKLVVNVLPEVKIKAIKNVSAGSGFDLQVLLSGQPPLYPVEIEYQILLNGSVIEDSVSVITSELQGTISSDIPLELNKDDNLLLEITNASNAFIGHAKQTHLIVIENNVAPLFDIMLTQGGKRVSVIEPDNGLVEMTTTINDINFSDTHKVTWEVQDDAFTGVSKGDDGLIFQFDPNSLLEKMYSIEVKVKETNTTDNLSVVQVVTFMVEKLTALTSATDSDGDGISDKDEGYGDNDGDGIANYLDNDNNPTRIPIGNNTEPMQTIPGLTMSLGKLTQGRGATSQDVSLTVAELSELVDDGAVDTQDNHFNAITPLYNFVIKGLEEIGTSVSVVVPLEKGTSLPAGTVYRKYNEAKGWHNFVEDRNNALYSAKVDTNGNCPPANDSRYVSGLTAGDNCIQLVIQDGGENDVDMAVNGVIEDPGAIVLEQQNQAPVIVMVNTYNVDENTVVVLDASNTTDAEGDSLTYHWQQTSGETVTLSDINNGQLMFTSPFVTQTSNLTFMLTVSDGIDAITMTVTVIVNQVNQAPMVTIEAHASQVAENGSIRLTANASDVDGDILSYVWAQTSGVAVGLDVTNSAQVTLSLPEVSKDEVITMQVIVNDGYVSSIHTSTLTISNKVIVVSPEPDKSTGGSVLWVLIVMAGFNISRRRLLTAA
jgi:hypothetical protein